MTFGSGAVLPQPVLDLMAAKSIEEFPTNQQTIDKELGPTPETLGDDLLPQPFQGDDMSVKVFYDHFCIWKTKMGAVNCNDEWYVVDFLYRLKMDLMVRVLRHKGIHRVSEAFLWAEIEEKSMKNYADMVFDEMSNPEPKHCDELQEAEDVENENSDELMVQIEEDSGKDVSPTTDDKVLDEMPLPAFIETAGCKVIESGEDTDSLQNYLAEALKFDKSTKPSLTGDGIEIVAPVGLRFNAVEDLFAPKEREVVPNSNKIMIYPLYDKGGNVMVLMDSTVMFYIDPGGIMVSLIPNKVENQLGVVEEQTYWMKMGCSKIGTSVDLQEDVYGGKGVFVSISVGKTTLISIVPEELKNGNLHHYSKKASSGILTTYCLDIVLQVDRFLTFMFDSERWRNSSLQLIGSVHIVEAVTAFTGLAKPLWQTLKLSFGAGFVMLQGISFYCSALGCEHTKYGVRILSSKLGRVELLHWDMVVDVNNWALLCGYRHD